MRIVVWTRNAYDATAGARITTLYYGRSDGTLYGTHTLGSGSFQCLVSPTGAKIVALGNKDIHLIDVASDARVQVSHALNGPAVQFNQGDELYIYWIPVDADYNQLGFCTALLDPSTLAFTKQTSTGLGDFGIAQDYTGTMGTIVDSTLYMSSGNGLWKVDLTTGEPELVVQLNSIIAPFTIIDTERLGYIDSAGYLTVVDYSGNLIASQATLESFNGGGNYARLSADRSQMVYITSDLTIWTLDLETYKLSSHIGMWSSNWGGDPDFVLEANTLVYDGKLLDLTTGTWSDVPWPWTYDGLDTLRALQFKALGAASNVAPAFWTGFVYAFETRGTLGTSSGGETSGGGDSSEVVTNFTLTVEDSSWVDQVVNLSDASAFLLTGSTSFNGSVCVLAMPNGNALSFELDATFDASLIYTLRVPVAQGDSSSVMTVTDEKGGVMMTASGTADGNFEALENIVGGFTRLTFTFTGGNTFFDDISVTIPT
ncbi:MULTISPECIES: hypothetical protein [unclassified Pseudomonas]|uniref:hypothetical protein n=1 Tax=unclassified Pseudomonas TaxID=196821 RepID=UPI00131B23BB|nr:MULTISPECIES: hypothetical protein [unclassified Pseudomonas]